MRSVPTGAKVPTKFRLPTSENLIPIRIDIEIDGQRYKDAFTWNPSEVLVFAKRTAREMKLPPTFITQIAQSMQSQITEFRSYEGQEMNTVEKLLPIKLDLRVNKTIIRDQFLWDVSNFESDPEEFARNLCRDLDIEDPEVGPAIAVAIREQLYEIAVQNVASARETRISKKGRRERGTEHALASKMGGTALDLMKLLGSKTSVVRRRREWDLYEPVVDILSNEEVEALEVREERNARMKKMLDEKDDGYMIRYTRM
ncbi:chromatin structure-remodeling complex protein BSH isoform X2 [Amborella trichopoda]|uniref:chromatin structure-remodeling complex protein BSH isoform X2 n=1 Tax=Amborella trichopoda TaxID=13333 RepID=UPI0005D3CDBF|nr:chromatin structure-remodeling complex protein BSH isoform X2 [Amborella trichopoda]|eukprot:XP_011621875.1 chromatin structure-remodeling complex protein BSH isoform X2 [Amborella trichopoda]